MGETVKTDPALDPTLETAASALRADLAARGMPADELPEPVVLALAAQQGRINQLEETCRIFHRWLERLSDAYAVLRAERFPDLSDDARAARGRIDMDAHYPPIPGVDPPAATPPEAPRFRHDCSNCEFLGRSADGTRDLYVCHRDGWLNARSSDNGNLRVNPDIFGRQEMGHLVYIAEAHRRAVARGLIGGAGEGEDSRLQQLIRDGQIGPR